MSKQCVKQLLHLTSSGGGVQKELAEVVPVLGLLLFVVGLLELPLILLEKLSVILIAVSPFGGELEQELEALLVVGLGISDCLVAGCEPLNDCWGSLRSFVCLSMT